MHDTDWERDFQRMLDAYDLTLDDVRTALPRVVSSLSPDEVETMRGVAFDRPAHMTEEQARLFCTLLVRAAALLATAWAERELAQRSSSN